MKRSMFRKKANETKDPNDIRNYKKQHIYDVKLNI